MFDVFSSRRLPVRLQVSSNDCGPTCLLMILTYHRIGVDPAALRQTIDPQGPGASAATILRAAECYGLTGRGIRTVTENLHRSPRGTLLFWKSNHFVVYERSSRRHLHVVDPAIGRRKIPFDLAADMFTGIAVEFRPAVTAVAPPIL